MSLRYLIIIATLSFSSVCSQQKDNTYWELILKNNTKEAFKNFKSLNKENDNSIELLITHEILRNENGFINGASVGFIDRLMSFEDFEYYLYALWSSPFLFDNYLVNGFHAKNSKTIRKFKNSKFKEPTIEYSYRYLNAVLERDNKNNIAYKDQIDQIPTIKEWQFCGVFENLNKSGFDISYEPERYAKDDKIFNANSNGPITWYTPNPEFTKESYQFFTNHSEYGYGVHYAQTFIHSDKNQRVQIRLGNSSAFKVWLNDVLVYENSKDVGTDIDAYIVNVNLSKGVNRLLIKNAENNGTPYFAARLSDVKGNPIDGLTYSSAYKKYNKGTFSSIQPEKENHAITIFFKDKVRQNPDNFFYKYCLIRTYLRNQKYEEANAIINPILEKYPKSSLLRVLKTQTYSYEGNYNAVSEMNKNLFLDDPDYYYSLMKKTADNNELTTMDISDLEVFLDKLTESIDYPVLEQVAKFVLNARNEDLKALRETMDSLNLVAADRVVILQKFIPLYDNIFNEKEKTIFEYEKVLKKKFSPALLNDLVVYYDKLNRKDDVIKLLKEYQMSFPSENEFLFALVEKLHAYNRYEESIKHIEELLKNYPYSFKAMEYMGNALLQIGKKEEAISYYEKALIYNNGNSALQKKIETLTRTENIIDDYIEGDIYGYIEKVRNRHIQNNYGATILLDNRVVQLYKTGGVKSKTVSLFEMTSETGVEDYKEYDLGLSGNYKILKAEIIKKDKRIIPAEKTKSKFVFNGLEVGDVIYIAYEYTSIGTGRFYKDVVDSYQFDSESFCLKTKYTFIAPKNTYFNHKVVNGELSYSKSVKDNYTIHNWELYNAPELPKSEDYMISNNDIARILHISTIKSWTDIANWYSDLVRSQSVFNAEVAQKFNEIFPEKDLEKLSEEERARRIYYYIMDNFNYSFVSFKQSGYIPQKPSKTIFSKLGDCKDFSTLFATLARKAGLDANLVLILTSDYGERAMVLPSQDFNHCIVKVKIDGKDQFLELTDKNLPFKSIPNSLVNAIGLEIPYVVKKGQESDLFYLKNIKGIPSEIISTVKIKVDENKRQNIKVHSKISGSLASLYFRALNQDNFDLVKKEISDDFKNRIGDDVVMDSISNVRAIKGRDFLTYDTSLHLDDKMNGMGSMTIFKLPIVSHAYSRDIVSLEKREYPIFYISYENTNFYDTTYFLEVPARKKIIEIPSNKKFSYKKHSYEMIFTTISDRKLKIQVIAKTDFKNISQQDYSAYKEYVEKILKAKDVLIGFK